MEEKTPTLKGRYGYIYKVIHIPSGEYYIGQKKGTSPETDNYLGSGSRWQNKLNKYPASEFKKEVLGWASSQEELNELEDKYVGNKYEKDPLCWNLRAGGMKAGVTEEYRKRLSEGHKGIRPSAETIRKRVSKLKGHSTPEEVRRKISLAQKGRKKTPEQIKKNSETHKGLVRSEESKRKQSETLKRLHSETTAWRNVHSSEEWRRKQHESHLGYKWSEESIRKRELTRKKKWIQKKYIQYFWLYMNLNPKNIL